MNKALTLKKFKAVVVYVNHASTINDEQQEPVLGSVYNKGAIFTILVARLDSENGMSNLLNVEVPVHYIGDFKNPQRGDIVWVEESTKRDVKAPIFIYSEYNNVPTSSTQASPVPQWGSFENDFGHLRSYNDHVRQFSNNKGNFITKYIKSIFGYRFRSFFNTSLQNGLFSLRGDPVFDKDESKESTLVAQGAAIGANTDINPLNTPRKREENNNFTYIKRFFPFLTSPITNNPDSEPISGSIEQKAVTKKVVMMNKNQTSYQPIMDNEYFKKTGIEREIPSAEEYIVALGDNKLVIQDNHGDGEQILITLKSQYGSNITIVQNKDNGQVRIRDNLGQGALFDGNVDKPSVKVWTRARQEIDMGYSYDTDSSYFYMRNGNPYGESPISNEYYGDKNSISNQEFVMLNGQGAFDLIKDKVSSNMKLSQCDSMIGMYSSGTTNNQGISFVKNGGLLTKTSEMETTTSGKQYEHEIVSITEGREVSKTSDVVFESEGIYSSITNSSTVMSGYSKDTKIMKTGDDEITETNEILGQNMQNYSKTHTSSGGDIYSNSVIIDGVSNVSKKESISQIDGTVISKEYGGASCVYTGKFIDKGIMVAEEKIDPYKTLHTRYLLGTASNTIIQDNGAISLERHMPNININIGSDLNVGNIVIGNALSNVVIQGVSVSALGTVTINGIPQIGS